MYKHIPITEQILYEIGFKTQTLLNAIRSQEFETKYTNPFAFIFTTRTGLGKEYIRKVADGGSDYWKVYIKGYSTPICYPKSLPLYDLFIIAGENFNSKSWHYYETTGTTITKDDIVVDCGAAVGTFSLSASSKAKKVYAIEPLPKFRKALKKTFEKVKNVEIVPFAVGDKKGTARMFDGSFGSIIDNRTEGIEIPIVTLDSLFVEKNKKISYIKADLEGYEMQMLKGAKMTIQKYSPKLAITVYHKENDYKKIQNFIKKINPNYTFYLRGYGNKHLKPVMLHAWVPKS